MEFVTLPFNHSFQFHFPNYTLSLESLHFLKEQLDSALCFGTKSFFASNRGNVGFWFVFFSLSLLCIKNIFCQFWCISCSIHHVSWFYSHMPSLICPVSGLLFLSNPTLHGPWELQLCIPTPGSSCFPVFALLYEHWFKKSSRLHGFFHLQILFL